MKMVRFGIRRVITCVMTHLDVLFSGPTTQETLSQTSTVRRLLTGFMTPFSRSDALAPTTPTSLAFQVSADDVLLLATGYDQKVRCWSCRVRRFRFFLTSPAISVTFQQKEMVSSLDITPESSSRTPAPNFVDGECSWLPCQGPFRTWDVLCFRGQMESESGRGERQSIHGAVCFDRRSVTGMTKLTYGF